MKHVWSALFLCLLIQVPGSLWSGLNAQSQDLPMDLVKGSVENERKEGVSGLIEFLDPKTDALVAQAELDEEGRFEIELPKFSQYYFVIRDGAFTYFFKDEAHIFKTTTKEVFTTISLGFQIYQYRRGTSIILHKLNFATNEHEILDAHHASLEFLTDFLMENPEMKIQVAGHTDNVGGESTNKELSKKRASAVKNYLIEVLNVPAERVTSYGYGESRPIASNETQTGRAFNRRTSFIITQNPE